MGKKETINYALQTSCYCPIYQDSKRNMMYALKTSVATTVASMRRTEALASVKFLQMPFLHWTHSIQIAPIFKRINWFASVTILVWLRHWLLTPACHLPVP